MSHLAKQALHLGLLCALVAAACGCSAKRSPAMTVSDLMEDRVTLDGVLMKCNQAPVKARSDADCLNARIAIERLALDVDPAEQAKRNEEFERSRAQLRLIQERTRQEQEASRKVDAYSLPVVPVDTAPPPGTTTTNPPAPLTGQSRP